MSYYKSNKHLSQSTVSDINRFGSDDTFVVDLECKVDSLKNISTNMHNELKKSKAHLSSVSKVFNSASLSLNTTLINMNKIARGYGLKLPLWALALIVAFILLFLFILFRRLLSR
ncbi:putative integral membrane protein [Theileria parva strain Muguga]|uniref:t-SNARE coiled-coil homology domain-containing protein n=1 Tax=Theileria parva TaxID=5875 RepID=Q4N7E4_THEPA|nr:putative integral membrane protein [Theileria parva strain Muguga]EAN34114.1 putative integral membrane protein [Theileria parva strain Muguga]|eukprot:XP_766397.1 hypothetical protein [Theileria parva strain Muguga]